MTEVAEIKRGLKTAAGYALGCLTCVAFLTWVLQLWKFKSSVPLIYGGDAFSVLTFVKAAIENGWFLHNEHLGAPWASDMYDYPTMDALHYVLMKLLSLAVANPLRVANLYFLLTFPLTTLSSLWVLRRFQVAWGPAIAVSVLYAFLPYHIERHLGHLFLASYYLIPPTVMVLVWIGLDRPILFHRDAATGRLRLHLLTFEALASLIICALVAGAGVYYAVFACFFLLVSGVASALARRRFYPLFTSGGLIGVIAAGLMASLVPTLLYQVHHGSNLGAVARSPSLTEVFALKVSHLLLPIPQHRLAAYLPYFGHGESVFGVSLGLVGAAGFVFLIVRFCLVRRKPEDRLRPMDVLGILNGCGVLLATVSSFGFLFSLLVSPWIRCYYRMCVYLSYFALFAVALLLNRVARKVGASRWLTAGFQALMALLLVGGVLDQTAPWWRPPYETARKLYDADAEFVHRIEAAVPAGAMVFQLPYMPFPEAGAAYRLPAYDHLRPYLHSKTIHWSFGAYREREGDRWQQGVSSAPVPEMVKALVLAGFRGIYVDRRGFADAGAALEARLSQVLGSAPLVSCDAHKTFFDLAAYRTHLKELLSDSAWDAASCRALHPVIATWSKGFSWLEEQGNDTWHWCAAQGELQLTNLGHEARQVVLEMELAIAQDRPAAVWLDSSLCHARMDVRPGARTPFKQIVTVPPGRSTLQLRCDGAPLPGASPRVLVFGVYNFRIADPGEEMTPARIVTAGLSR